MQPNCMTPAHNQATKKIGERIRHARVSQSISLEDLGVLTGMSWSTIGRIERGVQSPTAETLVRIASALAIDAGTLVQGITVEDYDGKPRYNARDFLRARDAEFKRRAR